MGGPAGQIDRLHQQTGGEGAQDRCQPEPVGEHPETEGQGQGGPDPKLAAAVLQPVEEAVDGGQVPDPAEGQADDCEQGEEVEQGAQPVGLGMSMSAENSRESITTEPISARAAAVMTT